MGILMNGQTDKSEYRVLVVDDNRAIQDDFRKILSSRVESTALSDLEMAVFGDCEITQEVAIAYELDFALQGEEAFHKVREAVDADRPYALAFVDMRMPPGWDGLETIEHFWEVDPDIQTVICTAYSDHSWSDIAKRLARQEQWLILKKPFDNVEVCQLAAALTKKWDLQRQAQARMQDLEKIIAERTAALQQEIDERKHAEEALREREARLRAIVDNAQDGIIIFDEHGVVESVNMAAENIFGYSQDQLCGNTLSELLSCSDDNTQAKHLHERFHSGAVVDLAMPVEARVQRKDNATLPVQLTVSDFTSDGRRLFTGILRDLTDYEKLQSELSQAQKLESAEQLVAGIAHEINTPIHPQSSY